MPNFTFNCPKCNTPLEAQEEWRGMETQCPNCSENLIVPLKVELKAKHKIELRSFITKKRIVLLTFIVLFLIGGIVGFNCFRFRVSKNPEKCYMNLHRIGTVIHYSKILPKDIEDLETTLKQDLELNYNKADVFCPITGKRYIYHYNGKSRVPAYEVNDGVAIIECPHCKICVTGDSSGNVITCKLSSPKVKHDIPFLKEKSEERKQAERFLFSLPKNLQNVIIGDSSSSGEKKDFLANFAKENRQVQIGVIELYKLKNGYYENSRIKDSFLKGMEMMLKTSDAIRSVN